MKIATIKNLSKQGYALQTFKDRFTWVDADFSVGDCHLDDETSKLINRDIQIVVEKHIQLLETRIKTEAGK